jgi:hypothetical protein
MPPETAPGESLVGVENVLQRIARVVFELIRWTQAEPARDVWRDDALLEHVGGRYPALPHGREIAAGREIAPWSRDGAVVVPAAFALLPRLPCSYLLAMLPSDTIAPRQRHSSDGVQVARTLREPGS